MSWWIMTMITIKISSLKGRHLEYTIHILLYCTYDTCEVVRTQQGMNQQQRSNARYSCLLLRCLAHLVLSFIVIIYLSTNPTWTSADITCNCTPVIIRSCRGSNCSSIIANVTLNPLVLYRLHTLSNNVCIVIIFVLFYVLFNSKSNG